MALTVQKDPEIFVEERVARLESHVEHIQFDVTELKADVRRIEGKVDAVKDVVSELRLDMIQREEVLRGEMRAGFDESFRRVDGRFNQVDDSFKKVDGTIEKIRDSDAEFRAFVYASFDKVNASIAALALSTEKSLSRMTRWSIGVAAAILTVMAHGFKWI